MEGQTQNLGACHKARAVTFLQGPFHLLQRPFDFGTATGGIQRLHLVLGLLLLLFFTQVRVSFDSRNLSLEALQQLQRRRRRSDNDSTG